MAQKINKTVLRLHRTGDDLFENVHFLLWKKIKIYFSQNNHAKPKRVHNIKQWRNGLKTHKSTKKDYNAMQSRTQNNACSPVEASIGSRELENRNP